jgi:hypothetical protein
VGPIVFPQVEGGDVAGVGRRWRFGALRSIVPNSASQSEDRIAAVAAILIDAQQVLAKVRDNPL